MQFLLPGSIIQGPCIVKDGRVRMLSVVSPCRSWSSALTVGWVAAENPEEEHLPDGGDEEEQECADCVARRCE